ncbi:MAG TPA: hypothetical protein VGB77_05965 [Abditibacteriaceae bacterium]|jgi:hypothetical protein
MQNKPALNKKYLYLHIAFAIVFYLAALIMKPFARARRAELAELFNVSTDTVRLFSNITNVFLLGVAFYFFLRVSRYFNGLSALSPQEIEERERRKRELAEEDAKARAWVHSSDT